jgi:hypothetical protein
MPALIRARSLLRRDRQFAREPLARCLRSARRRPGPCARPGGTRDVPAV